MKPIPVFLHKIYIYVHIQQAHVFNYLIYLVDDIFTTHTLSQWVFPFSASTISYRIFVFLFSSAWFLSSAHQLHFNKTTSFFIFYLYYFFHPHISLSEIHTLHTPIYLINLIISLIITHPFNQFMHISFIFLFFVFFFCFFL